MIQNESIQRGSVTTSFYNILGKMLNFFVIFLVSYYFGANRTTDIYYLTFSFIMLLSLFLVSQQSNVFMPIFVRTRTEKGEEAAWKFTNALVTYTALTALFFSFVFFLFSSQIIKGVSDFSHEEIYEGRTIIILFAPVITLYVVTEFLKVIIQSYRQFSLPAKTALLNGIFNILIIIFLHNLFGVSCLAISLIVAYTLQIIVMLVYIKKHSRYFGISFVPVPEFRSFFRLGLPVFISQIIGSAAFFFPDVLCTMFDGGTLTMINYAQRIYSLPNDMIVLPFSSVIAPFFVEYSSNYSALSDEYIKYNGMLWFVLIPVSVILIFYSESVSRLLFFRGKINEENIIIVSSSLKYFSISIFALSFGSLSGRLFCAIQKTGCQLLLGIFGGPFMIIMTYICTKNLGFTGIPISRTLSVIFTGVVMPVIFIKIYLREIKFSRLIPKLVVPVFISILAITGSSIIENFFKLIMRFFTLRLSDNFYNIIKLMLAGITFLLIYLSVSYIVKLTEVKYFGGLLLRHIKRMFT